MSVYNTSFCILFLRSSASCILAIFSRDDGIKPKKNKIISRSICKIHCNRIYYFIHIQYTFIECVWMRRWVIKIQTYRNRVWDALIVIRLYLVFIQSQSICSVHVESIPNFVWILCKSIFLCSDLFFILWMLLGLFGWWFIFKMQQYNQMGRLMDENYTKT